MITKALGTSLVYLLPCVFSEMKAVCHSVCMEGWGRFRAACDWWFHLLYVSHGQAPGFRAFLLSVEAPAFWGEPEGTVYWPPASPSRAINSACLPKPLCGVLVILGSGMEALSRGVCWPGPSRGQSYHLYAFSFPCVVWGKSPSAIDPTSAPECGLRTQLQWAMRACWKYPTSHIKESWSPVSWKHLKGTKPKSSVTLLDVGLWSDS